jgi:hypothetical protein
MAFSLNPSDKTFIELKTGKYPWWDNLKKNKNISIQIRQDNKIDVYYNGGAILGELVYDEHKRAFSARIHPKYIPLEKDNEYMTLTLTDADVKIIDTFVPMGFSNFENEKLKLIMARVKKYHDSESEKAIQYNFATSDPCIIDAEFQINRSSRVDLVRLDVNSSKIVLIEVKTIGDSRLFSDPTKDTKNIYHQLKKYQAYAIANKDALLAYYKKVLQVKNNLGLTNPSVRKLTLDNWKIEFRPLLLFGDCTQSWINNNATDIDKKIKDVAYGAYYFGSSDRSLDLIPKTQKNRHVF